MKPFDSLTLEQVNSVHLLYSLLRKLKIIGLMRTSTRQFSYDERGRVIRYQLKFLEYIPEMKGQLTPDERIANILSKGLRKP